jgi:ferritin
VRAGDRAAGERNGGEKQGNAATDARRSQSAETKATNAISGPSPHLRRPITTPGDGTNGHRKVNQKNLPNVRLITSAGVRSKASPEDALNPCQHRSAVPGSATAAQERLRYTTCSQRPEAMKELTRAINDHLAAEFQASHTYLAMSIWLREKDLAGFSTYMLDKSNEERTHASRMIAYLVDSDEQVELPTVEAPERQWPSMQGLFDAVYELEKGVTASINRLYGIAEQQGARSATAMLDWFVAEQLQEEAEARFVSKRLRLAGDNSAALLLLDQQFLEGTALSHVKGGLSGTGGANEA